MDAIDFRMNTGDTKTLAITVRDDNQDPVDITDAEITWVMIKQPGADALVSKVTPDHISFPDPATGVFFVPLDPEDTASLPPLAYHYEAEVITSDAESHTVLTGRVILDASSILPA